jgi:hypothetical protein
MSTATQDEPDHRIFQFIYDPDRQPGYSPLGPEIPSAPTRFWREIEENNRNLRGDSDHSAPVLQCEGEFSQDRHGASRARSAIFISAGSRCIR